MAIYQHKILYEKGVIAKLAKEFSVSEATVRNALRFSTDSIISKQIRTSAIDNHACKRTKVRIVDELSTVNP